MLHYFNESKFFCSLLQNAPKSFNAGKGNDLTRKYRQAQHSIHLLNPALHSDPYHNFFQYTSIQLWRMSIEDFYQNGTWSVQFEVWWNSIAVRGFEKSLF